MQPSEVGHDRAFKPAVADRPRKLKRLPVPRRGVCAVPVAEDRDPDLVEGARHCPAVDGLASDGNHLPESLQRLLPVTKALVRSGDRQEGIRFRRAVAGRSQQGQRARTDGIGLNRSRGELEAADPQPSTSRGSPLFLNQASVFTSWRTSLAVSIVSSCMSACWILSADSTSCAQSANFACSSSRVNGRSGPPR